MEGDEDSLKWVLAITKCDEDLEKSQKIQILNKINTHLKEWKEEMVQL